MGIAALSMEMSSASLKQSAGLGVTKKAMDSQEQQAAGLLDMMSKAAPSQIPQSGVGQVVDVRA